MIVSSKTCISRIDLLTDVPLLDVARITNAISVEVSLIKYISSECAGKYLISRIIAKEPNIATSTDIILSGT